MNFSAPTILWFRLDLRVSDHPALMAALARKAPVIPLFVWDPEAEGEWAPGSASRWWLHHSLNSLDDSLRARGSRLVIRHGSALSVLQEVVQETGATAVYWSRRYESSVVERDKKIKEHFKSVGVETRSFNSNLLREPWEISNKSGGPFQVFTPFWKTVLTQLPSIEPSVAPRRIFAPERFPKSCELNSLELTPSIPWDQVMKAVWQPGESGALKALINFIGEKETAYDKQRDFPAEPGTSLLSPHLHFGEISPRQIASALSAQKASGWEQSRFFTEIGWREFGYHLLWHFPQTPDQPLREEFKKFPWKTNAKWLKAWQRGKTGYPIVDAGMRELWATGWMHNRVRMIVGSFLVKNLLIPWQEGAKWFWDTLVDADLASNTLGWQWVSGCGADAAPYFRIFNPITQGKKFDPDGAYVRRWVPEIKSLNTEWIHNPWDAPEKELIDAGIELGKTYPKPLVSHLVARTVALEAYAKIKGKSQAE